MYNHPLGTVASSALFALLWLAATPQPSFAQLGGAPSAFLGQLGGLGGTNASAPAAPVCTGKTPAKLIIESVTPVSASPDIVIRNTGGQTANITGYRLSGGAENQTDESQILYIARERRCSENGTIPSGQSKAFKPRSETNPCGYPFKLGASGSVTLSDYNGSPVSKMSWTDAQDGTQVHVTPDGSSAVRVPGNKSVIDVLQALGDYQTFLLALQATGLDQQLRAPSNPDYAGPVLPEQQYQIDLPWWFAGSQGAAAAAAPPPPPAPAPTAPPPAGVPAQGPYTILAPTDEAFDNLLTNMGGGQKLPLDALLRLPQLKDIIEYHIVPGEDTSEYLRNNTPIYTAKGVEVVPFADGCMTEGKLMLHDSCIDKPTGDNYTCIEQKQFQKCDFPFMRSALAAQWQGGYCQRTCQRCDCSPASGIQCATVQSADIQASNGVIQSISRVLFPPPVFSKADAVAAAAAYNASLARNQSLGIAPAPGMLGLNDVTGLPGAAAPLTPGVTPGGAGPTALPGSGGAGPTPLPGASLAPNATSTAPAVNATSPSPERTPGESPAPGASPAAGPPAGRRRRFQKYFNRR